MKHSKIIVNSKFDNFAVSIYFTESHDGNII